MDLAEEAKSLWPISYVFSAPLLLEQKSLGPLLFSPSPTKITTIRIPNSGVESPFSSYFSSAESPFPRLSLPRFLETTDDSILPSTASSIASSFFTPPTPPLLLDNSLQMFRCSRSGRLLLFFPMGHNLDQVGFVLLSIQAAQAVVDFSGATKGLNHRISSLLVQKVSDDHDDDGFGYLFISTMYSVFCYAVRLPSFSDTPKLELLGTKCFTSAVVHASWSPHLLHECVVLLQTGNIFLFDFEPFFHSQGLIDNIKCTNLRVPWDSFLDVIGEQGLWLSCEFSWHPRILVVANSSAIFLVDFRFEGCKVECLLRISMLACDNFIQLDDQFVAFSKAGTDGFCYTVACNSFLFLCDVRKPLKPLVQWSHCINNPAFITVVKLSKLRSALKNDDYMSANSENGYGILMGSFWNCEFSLFCYGPDTRTCASSKISSFCRSFYAWGLPSELSLAARNCFCASCLLREESSKTALPKWIDWRQKEDIVLGFCILDDDLSVQLFEPENSGGFTLIRLMSSGNLELQRYFASHEAANISHEARQESTVFSNESLLHGTGNEEYKFSTQFPFLKLDHLYGYLNSKFDKV